MNVPDWVVYVLIGAVGLAGLYFIGVSLYNLGQTEMVERVVNEINTFYSVEGNCNQPFSIQSPSGTIASIVATKCFG